MERPSPCSFVRVASNPKWADQLKWVVRAMNDGHGLELEPEIKGRRKVLRTRLTQLRNMTPRGKRGSSCFFFLHRHDRESGRVDCITMMRAFRGASGQPYPVSSITWPAIDIDLTMAVESWIARSDHLECVKLRTLQLPSMVHT